MKRMSVFIMAFTALLTAISAQSEIKKECNENDESMLRTIMTRTSIRQYTDQPVEREKIEVMLHAGMAAPTAVNAQPWHFVVVNDKTKLGELAAANPRASMLKSAPLAIVVCGDMTKALEGKGRQFWIQDCSAATENILLAAHAQGLGAVWTALYPMEERMYPVSAALKLPEALVPLCTIVIGYPAEQPKPKDKWKAENVSYNEYRRVK